MKKEREKIFRGRRNGIINTVTLNNKTMLPREFKGLPLRFDWGNNSDETKQLAYAMLCNVCDIDIANRLYIEYSTKYINYIMAKQWTLPESRIKKEVKKIWEWKSEAQKLKVLSD